MSRTTVQIQFDHFKEINETWNSRLGLVIQKTANDLGGLIKTSIEQQGMVDTGAYLNSWFGEKTGDLEAIVYSDKEYGPYLEYGTVHMTDRPHVTPAAEGLEGPFAAAAKEAIGHE